MQAMQLGPGLPGAGQGCPQLPTHHGDGPAEVQHPVLQREVDPEVEVEGRRGLDVISLRRRVSGKEGDNASAPPRLLPRRPDLLEPSGDELRALGAEAGGGPRRRPGDLRSVSWGGRGAVQLPCDPEGLCRAAAIAAGPSPPPRPAAGRVLGALLAARVYHLTSSSPAHRSPEGLECHPHRAGGKAKAAQAK